MSPYQEFVKNRIWLIEYPILYMGIGCNARTSLIRADDGTLIVHSPAPLTDETRRFVDDLGPVKTILAPGTFHNLYAAQWRDAYGDAQLYVCPGLERKVPSLRNAAIIRDGVRYPWSAELDHLTTQGFWLINEVVFLHRSTRTLIVTDLIESFTDETPANWVTQFWLKYVFFMWNHPKPAPEYQLGWSSRRKARAMLERVLEWDFTQIVVGHGQLFRDDAKAVARRAWSSFLG